MRLIGSRVETQFSASCYILCSKFDTNLLSFGSHHLIVYLVGAITSGLPFSIVAKHYSWSSVFLLLEAVTCVTVVVMVLCINMKSEIGKPKLKTR